MTQTHPDFSFQTSTETIRTSLNIKGTPIATLFTIATAVPGQTTKRDLTKFVDLYSRKVYSKNPEDHEWEVRIPGLDELVRWEDGTDELSIQGLYAEVAQVLNDYGISVTDWPPYRLEEEPHA